MRTRAKQSDPGGSELALEQAPPAPRRATRRTRQTRRDPITDASGSDAANQDATSNESTTVQAVRSTQSKGSLVADPIPRRGARPTGRAHSIISIATLPQKGEGASDDEDDEDEEGQTHQQVLKRSANETNLTADTAVNGKTNDPQAEKTWHQVMLLSLSDLVKASRELMNRLQDADYEDVVFRKLLQVKRSTFFTIRDVFEDTVTSPFLNWNWLSKLEEPNPDASKAVPWVLVLANLVTALELVEREKYYPNFDPLPLLEHLDDQFPKLFTLPSNKSQYPQLALDIRTLRFVETLAAVKANTDPRKVMISIFCDTSGSKPIKELPFEGPYRSLGGLKEQELADACSSQLLKLWETLSENGTIAQKPPPIAQLRDKYPIRNLLNSLREWLLNMYAASTSRLDQNRDGFPQVRAESEVFHDAEEDVAESVAGSVAESQPIMRSSSVGPGRTLFQSEESIKQLKAITEAAEQANNNAAQDGDDDEEDAFETDTRPVDNGKRAAIAAYRPIAKRPRTNGQGPAYSASTSMPPPPRPDRLLAPSPSAPQHAFVPSSSSVATSTSPSPSSPSRPPSTALDFAAIHNQKLAARQNARLQVPITYKQRHVWSDRDSAVLLERIAERRAAWATIDKEDGGHFELRRNAQAYRDRARNMKVDFLITDSVLPPAFDLVTLGKKEIERLMRLGKNPSRREEDVDEDGRPTNTEFRFVPQEEEPSPEL